MSTIINDEYCSRDIPTDFQLLPCAICGRTFQPLSLEKHYIACERNASIKRPVFDSMKKRLAGTELELYNNYSYSSYSPNPIRKKIANNHANYSSAISPSSPNNSYESRLFRSNSVSRPLGKNEHCPYCERQFGPKAFDDHVKWCKEHYFFNRNQKKNVDISLKEAKERLDARIKYRVPPVQKSKRTLVKEKYSTPPPCPLKRTESVNDLTVEKGASNNDVFFKRTTSLRKPKISTSLNCYALKSPSIPLDYSDSQTKYSSTCSSVSSISNEVQFLKSGLLCMEVANAKREALEQSFYRDNIQNRSLHELEKDYLHNLYMLSNMKIFPNNKSKVTENVQKVFSQKQLKIQLKKPKAIKKTRNVSIDKKSQQHSNISCLMSSFQIRNQENFDFKDIYSFEIFNSTFNNDEYLEAFSDSSRSSVKEFSVLKNTNTSTSNILIEKNDSDNVLLYIRKSDLIEILNKQCSEYDCSPFQSAERQFMELLQCDDFKIFSEEKNIHKSTDTKQSKSNASEQNTTESYDLSADFKIPSTSISKTLAGSSLTKSSLAELKTFENGCSNIFAHNCESKKTTNDQNIVNVESSSHSPPSSLSSIDNNTSPKSPNDVSHQNNKNVIKNFFTFNSRNNSENRHIFAGAKNLKSETDSEQQTNCTKSKYCHECGTKYPIESAKFCVECGVKRLIV